MLVRCCIKMQDSKTNWFDILIQNLVGFNVSFFAKVGY